MALTRTPRTTACRGVQRSVREYNGLSWSTMVCHGVQRSVGEYNGLSGSTMACHGVQWTVLEYSRLTIPRSIRNVNVLSESKLFV